MTQSRHHSSDVAFKRTTGWNGCKDLQVLLSMQQLGGVEIRHIIIGNSAGECKRWNDTKRWQDLEVFRALESPLQFGFGGTHPQVVQDNIAVIVMERRRWMGFILCLLDLLGILIVGIRGGIRGVLEVVEDGLDRVWTVGWMGRTTVFKVGDIAPFARQCLERQGPVVGESESEVDRG